MTAEAPFKLPVTASTIGTGCFDAGGRHIAVARPGDASYIALAVNHFGEAVALLEKVPGPFATDVYRAGWYAARAALLSKIAEEQKL